MILYLWPLAMVVRASFLNGFGWFLPPLYFLCQISTQKIIEPLLTWFIKNTKPCIIPR
ncbi:hypothetical protein HMPREF1705_04712 [Acetomicrobium hydrogeniformans ATCC BAA-1850]|uniref:Uncharacterized protein n=1 Tax=Acetomicrobium hydrogeniformans ATCC BAA-1850 TaxID=592015 RepID=A0A0T5XD96_9BACT|nr:hypothetical protein HMPREF1705_04712 [Acetomicrobium hydrogeniformans ATCC BAA-1850]